jgi:hypothetical protein
MRIAAVAVFLGLCGLMRADNVSCNIPASLMGSCSSVQEPNTTLTGSLSLTIGGPGVYNPTPNQFAFSGPIQFITSYTFDASLQTTATNGAPDGDSITLTVTIPIQTGQWAAYGYQSSNPMNGSGGGAFVVTDNNGLHTGLNLCDQAGCESPSVLFNATDGSLQITFSETAEGPGSISDTATLLEIGTPEPATFGVGLLGIIALAAGSIVRRRRL